MLATATHARLEKELHDLSQPLTSLMCQLEYGQMMGDSESLQTAVAAALVECRRVFGCVATMRSGLDSLNEV